MNYKKLLPNLKYRRLIKAPKRNYHILEGEDHFLVFSPKDDGTGNYTIVPKKAVQFLTKKLGGTQSNSTAEVFAACKGSKFFPHRMAALNALYALVGSNGASSRIKDGKLYFNVWKQ